MEKRKVSVTPKLMFPEFRPYLTQHRPNGRCNATTASDNTSSHMLECRTLWHRVPILIHLLIFVSEDDIMTNNMVIKNQIKSRRRFAVCSLS